MNNRKILKAAGVIALGAAVGLVLKMLNTDDNSKYSDNWFELLSDDEFYAEREPVRKKARENGGDEEAERLLQRFNKEESRRAANRSRSATNRYPVHREHGWYLPNDD